MADPLCSSSTRDAVVQHPNRSAIPFYEAKLLAGGFFMQFKIEEQGGEFVGVCKMVPDVSAACL